ncbi:uncharacterized protein VTP21DRAFT_4030 [Calcarisporiella thermophila]|uniref:uncharacterized protein n=1 Tax=Calcarisporiella thermophila TaxID=911321 RepID=UPI003742A453
MLLSRNLTNIFNHIPLKPQPPTLFSYVTIRYVTGRGSKLRKGERKPTPISSRTRGHIPARFKLLPIESDVGKPGIARKYEKRGDPIRKVAKSKMTAQTESQNDGNANLVTVKQMEKLVQNARFEDLNLYPSLLTAVHTLLGPDAKPTDIQALAIPSLLGSASPKPNKQSGPYLCAAETGSGKTLAYLLPSITRIKYDEVNERTQIRKPRVVVLVPSRELSNQLLQVCKKLAHIVKFRAVELTNRMERRRIVRSLSEPVDVLVSTPLALADLYKEGELSLNDTRYIIVDEADTMLEKEGGFATEVKQAVETVRKRGGEAVFVSATLPKALHAYLTENFPHLVRITTPSLHRPLPRLQQVFIDVNKQYNGNKQLALLDVLRQNAQKTMIFCNTRHGASLLHSFLQDRGYPSGALYGGLQDREATLDAFRQGEMDILVCTDIASRGVDTLASHIILYDFPTNVVDYLHRVGRTARAGKRGKATSLVTKRSRQLAERVWRCVRDGTVLS